MKELSLQDPDTSLKNTNRIEMSEKKNLSLLNH